MSDNENGEKRCGGNCNCQCRKPAEPTTPTAEPDGE